MQFGPPPIIRTKAKEKIGEKMSEQNPNLKSGDGIHSDSEDDDFEFEFAVTGGDDTHPEPAVYPVFDRSLLLDPHPIAPLSDLRSGSNSSSSSSSSATGDDDGLPAGSYCAWSPSSPDRWKKSSSTGSAALGSSASRRFRLKDLVSGRSRSDGKEKFAFMKPNPNPNLRREKKDVKPGEMDLLTAHRLFYGEKGVKGGRAYLPQRPGSVGLFPNGNGLSRTKFPFIE
ncbi:proline-rich receptor-like protein kinase PERK7 [Iris pallida]|uniref:Proline-rich receptor-like protein kinase PERK7 n=1 Tax=Iris pallida TaxID=29817 RepID=A0AAX6DM61_IRIPA|nr:proline-rich receptor-like protein kinase PERK7 [Iris pallida]